MNNAVLSAIRGREEYMYNNRILTGLLSGDITEFERQFIRGLCVTDIVKWTQNQFDMLFDIAKKYQEIC